MIATPSLMTTSPRASLRRRPPAPAPPRGTHAPPHADGRHPYRRCLSALTPPRADDHHPRSDGHHPCLPTLMTATPSPTSASPPPPPWYNISQGRQFAMKIAPFILQLQEYIY
ncbi:hypothetical protein GUJ93_ZPchr0008g13160 [Zizania palustris]|uniref:Uncharacterized protein n=1 Tax=Zizania palustris TaxID=103762 RepID=A0A8J5RX04_ZIZPA|nr:hypothetical protein GUJ93_ZPchr0008g13160 [Zizania palustris]